MKARIRYHVASRRWDVDKNGAMTIEIEPEWFRTWDVDSMERRAIKEVRRRTGYAEAGVTIKTIRVGSTIFQL